MRFFSSVVKLYFLYLSHVSIFFPHLVNFSYGRLPAVLLPCLQIEGRKKHTHLSSPPSPPAGWTVLEWGDHSSVRTHLVAEIECFTTLELPRTIDVQCRRTTVNVPHVSTYFCKWSLLFSTELTVNLFETNVELSAHPHYVLASQILLEDIYLEIRENNFPQVFPQDSWIVSGWTLKTRSVKALLVYQPTPSHARTHTFPTTHFWRAAYFGCRGAVQSHLSTQ